MSEWSSARFCDVVNLLLGMLLFFSRWLGVCAGPRLPAATPGR